MNLDNLLADFAPFADLGEDAPSGTYDDQVSTIRMVRNGQQVTISVNINPEQVTATVGNDVRQFRSVSGLLASPAFSDLARWADSQKLMLSRTVGQETLPIRGKGSDQEECDAVSKVDELLTLGLQNNNRNSIAVVDGPAGIGKTSLVKKLALSRATNFRTQQKPLILHVESRGRVLQNISDLMAFSLQTLRLSVTYDQIPTLVKYGLVTMAIDGFDELGDPDGYDLAWAQLNDLMEATRGRGSYILSGRETFISGTRIRKALPAIIEPLDSIETFSVAHIAPPTARSWLRQQGWSEEAISSDSAASLFSPNSYALRPFFLRQLASPEVAERILSGVIDDTLSFLIGEMLDREQTKFGRDVEASTTERQRRDFITSLMEEVARDLAENQTDAISSDTLSWLSDAVSEELPSGVQGILRNRADVLAFLTNDDRRGFKRFIHEEVQNYFLGQVTLKSVINNEVPKYIRRNIFGLDFLENFTDVVRYKDGDYVNQFVLAAERAISNLPDSDRGKRNLASLIICCCSISDLDHIPNITDVSIDECYITETVCPIQFTRVTFAQLDARDADFRAMQFDECHLVTLIGNEGTIPSQTVPTPSVLATPNSIITLNHEIENWLGERFDSISEYIPHISISEALKRFPTLKLLSRFARYKPFWLKDGDDKAARRILQDEHWPLLLEILRKNDLIMERQDVPAKGPKATFYHLRNSDLFTSFDIDNPIVMSVVKDTFEALRDV